MFKIYASGNYQLKIVYNEMDDFGVAETVNGAETLGNIKRVNGKYKYSKSVLTKKKKHFMLEAWMIKELWYNTPQQIVESSEAIFWDKNSLDLISKLQLIKEVK